MTSARIEGYGRVDFDPMNYDNNSYELYLIRSVDPETDRQLGTERYTSEDDYLSAIRNTFGRKVVSELEFDSFCEVEHDGCVYECNCVRHVACVVDNDEFVLANWKKAGAFDVVPY